jgi:hypothetical protein
MSTGFAEGDGVKYTKGDQKGWVINTNASRRGPDGKTMLTGLIAFDDETPSKMITYYALPGDLTKTGKTRGTITDAQGGRRKSRRRRTRRRTTK